MFDYKHKDGASSSTPNDAMMVGSLVKILFIYAKIQDERLFLLYLFKIYLFIYYLKITYPRLEKYLYIYLVKDVYEKC